MNEAAAPVALRIGGVSHAFGQLRALDDVSLAVQRGEFVALLGVNGAGKSTLFSLITRLYDNVSGSIEVCGHDVRREPGPALAHMGVVFQSRSLDMSLTIRQNLRYHAALHGIGRREAIERGDTVLERVGLLEKGASKVATLSGGQVRRAEIARALMHDPTLLLLDEATVGLDVRSRTDVVDTVRALADTGEVGVLWATHLFDEVRVTDPVVLLHEGKVLAQGTAGEIAGEATLSDRFLTLTGVDEREIAA